MEEKYLLTSREPDGTEIIAAKSDDVESLKHVVNVMGNADRVAYRVYKCILWGTGIEYEPEGMAN